MVNFLNANIFNNFYQMPFITGSSYNPFANFSFFLMLNFQPMVFPPIAFPQFTFNLGAASSIFSVAANNNIAKVDTFTPSNSSNNVRSSGLGQQVLSKAASYVGVVNSTAQGNELFSPAGYRNTQWFKSHGRWGWCYDFVKYCLKSVLGDKLPKKMANSSSPHALKNYSEGAYMSLPSSSKAEWVKANVKPGDPIYMKGKGDSGTHAAIFDHIEGNTIYAVSGNSSGKVRRVTYNVETSGIYGFVSVDKLAA